MCCFSSAVFRVFFFQQKTAYEMRISHWSSDVCSSDLLADRAYLAGDYSIADMAAFPWIAYLEPERGIAPLPHVQRWRDEIAARPAVRAAYGKAGSVDAGYARADNGATLFPWEGLLEHVIVV